MTDSLLHRLRLRDADATAYTFLGPDQEVQWTWGQLRRTAGGVAAALRARCAPGDRVLLLHPQGLDYVAALLGCMEAGVLAVPLQPPGAHRPQLVVPKLEAITADGGVALACTVSARLDAVKGLLAGSALEGLDWVATDTLPEADLPVEPAPAEVAYLQYTSGSTSTPKGVMVTHAGIVTNLETFDQDYGHDAGSCMVSWLPAFHDLGLVYGVMMPLFRGFHGVILDPVGFLRRPASWLQAIHRFRGTHAPAPNFAFDLCAAKVSPDVAASLDLSCWKVALNGAEPIRYESEQRFVEAFGVAGVRWETMSHAYGMSEATAVIAKEPVGTAPVWFDLDGAALEQHRVVPADPGPNTKRVAGCGVPVAPTVVAAVDPDTHEILGPDRV
ncbi:MAG: AMP-binding protein, partial [Myxococcales bacterium]|nr:AMP-binding protein [Myxococcales bacterium]